MKNILIGFIMSMSMFSKIPSPQVWKEEGIGLLMPMFPFVGGILGAIWFLLYRGLLGLDAPPMIGGALLAVFPVLITGGIHMDGFMDTNDAIGSRGNLEKKREILKDSHVGAFAVIWICIYFLLSFGGIYEYYKNGGRGFVFIFLPMLSRAIVAISVTQIKPMVTTGYAAMYMNHTKAVHKVAVILAGIGIISVSFLVADPLVAGALAIGSVIGVVTVRLLTKEFEGFSGDLCGYTLTLIELSVLVLIGLA